MTEEKIELKSPVAMKLTSLNDLLRLVISSVGPDRSSGYIGYYLNGDTPIYFIFNTSLGYYDLNALPIIIWVEGPIKDNKSFIRYRTSPKEEMSFSDEASDPKWLNIPLVHFEEMPKFLRIWEK